MPRIVGLDLGAYSVKALMLDSSTRSYQVRASHEVPRAEGDGTTLAASLTELLNKVRPVDTLIVALPGLGIATHWLTLPFSDPKRLDATIPFEIESQLPFDLSDAVFDYQLTPAAKGDGAEILVGVVRKDELRQLLELLKSA